MDVVATMNAKFAAIRPAIHDFSLQYMPPAMNELLARVKKPLSPPSFMGDDDDVGIVVWKEEEGEYQALCTASS
jgi:hypothetical protein